MGITNTIKRVFARKNITPVQTPVFPVVTGTINIADIDCQVKDGLINLTDLWKASKGKPSQKPTFWLRQTETLNLLKSLTNWAKLPLDQLLVRQNGRSGGTFAHWQIALSYAQWLSPELQIEVSSVFKRFREADTELIENAIGRVKNPEDLKRIEARVRNKQSNIALNGAIVDCGGTGKTCAFVANNNNVAITGKTAKELRKEHNLPEKASTRPYLDTDQMIDMAFLERLERKSLEKLRPKGHDAVLTICDCAIDTVKEAIAKHI